MKKQRVIIHSKELCMGPCPFHSPSNHHMRKWPKNVRIDKSFLTERICKHGVGHPDPDSLKWLNDKAMQIHGCDGCCIQKPGRKI